MVQVSSGPSGQRNTNPQADQQSADSPSSATSDLVPLPIEPGANSSRDAKDNDLLSLSLLLRMPAVPSNEQRGHFIRDSTIAAEVDPSKNAAALEALGIDSEKFGQSLQVTNTYGRHWQSFIAMARGIFPKLASNSPDIAAAIESIQEGESASSSNSESLSPSQKEVRQQVLSMQKQFDDFLDSWYHSKDSSVRAQLISQLQQCQPEFNLEFSDRRDLDTAAQVLGGEITQYKICYTLPENFRELFINFMGLGGFSADSEAPHQHLISVGAVSRAQVEASGNKELVSIVNQLPDLSQQSSLGQTLIHEEVHARTGYPQDNPGQFRFQTAEEAAEVPSVLFELITITHAYHGWMEARNPDYSYRRNPTGIVLETASGRLPIDFVYREARERFGLLSDDGLDKFLSLIDKPETTQFLNQLIWGSSQAPRIAEEIPEESKSSRQ